MTETKHVNLITGKVRAKFYVLCEPINYSLISATLNMNAVLITGANRGLGLGMVKYLIQHNKAQKIIATCRKTSVVRTKIMTYL